MFELKEYSKDVIDIASSWLGIKHPAASSILTTLKLVFDLPTKIVMHKLCRILSKQEPDFFEWLKISENFDKDATNYNTTIRQLILCINAINEEALFDVYANLMRSWQLGFIDKQKFLRLSWVLTNIYSEDLFYLKKIYDQKDVEQCEAIIALQNVGFTQSYTRNTYGSIHIPKYNITEYGYDMLQYGIDYENFQLYKHYREEKQAGETDETKI